MPAKLNIGLSRKVGEANYGSRGASINLEVELDSATLTDVEQLQNRVRSLSAMARQSVEDELEDAEVTANGAVAGIANGNGAASREKPANATQSQVRAIFAIARRKRLDANSLARDWFNVNRPEDLSIREASSLIDQLNNGKAEVRP